MNRRNFCRLVSLAALAAALRGSAATNVPCSRIERQSENSPLRRCRITVLRRNCFADLQSRYLDDPETGFCEHFTEGQTFTVDSAHVEKSPEGFCPLAWECVRRHVERVLDNTTAEDCGVSLPADGSVIACCNDGTRPVVFKISPA